MDNLLKTTDWITCPYDPNHRMKYSKFHNHFVKCKEAHRDDPREQCPYYASELVHPDDMKDHLIICKYKALYPDLYFDACNLPVYNAPYHINFDEENENESGDHVETVTTIRDDKSSLLSGSSSRSDKSTSTVSLPIGKLYRNNYIDPKPRMESYAFKYIEDDDVSNSLSELKLPSDTSSNSCDFSNSQSPPSNQSTYKTSNVAESFRKSHIDTTLSNQSVVNGKVGLGRGKVIQRLLSSSTSSLDINKVTRGRRAWFLSVGDEFGPNM